MTTFNLKFANPSTGIVESVEFYQDMSSFQHYPHGNEINVIKSNPIDNIHLFVIGLTNHNGESYELRVVIDGNNREEIVQELTPLFHDNRDQIIIRSQSWDSETLSTYSHNHNGQKTTISSYEFTKDSVLNNGILGQRIGPDYDANVTGVRINGYQSAFNNDIGFVNYSDYESNDQYIKIIKYADGQFEDKVLDLPAELRPEEIRAVSFSVNDYLIFSTFGEHGTNAESRQWKININEYFSSNQAYWEPITREIRNYLEPNNESYFIKNPPNNIHDHVNYGRFDLIDTIYSQYNLKESTFNKFKIAAVEVNQGGDWKVVVYDTHQNYTLFAKDLIPGERLLKSLDGDEFYETYTTTPTPDGNLTIKIQQYYYGLNNTGRPYDAPIGENFSFKIPNVDNNNWLRINEWVPPSPENNVGYLFTSSGNHSIGNSSREYQIYKVNTLAENQQATSIPPPNTGNGIGWLDFGFVKDGQLHLKTFDAFVSWDDQHTESYWKLQTNNTWAKINNSDDFWDAREQTIGTHSIVRIDDAGFNIDLLASNTDPNVYVELLDVVNPVIKIPDPDNNNKYLIKLYVDDSSLPIDYEKWIVYDSTGNGRILAEKSFNSLNGGLQTRTVDGIDENSAFIYYQKVNLEFGFKTITQSDNNIDLYRVALSDVESLLNTTDDNINFTENFYRSFTVEQLLGRPSNKSNSSNEIVFLDSAFIHEGSNGSPSHEIHIAGVWDTIKESESHRFVVRLDDDGKVVSRTLLEKGYREGTVYDPNLGNLFVQIDEYGVQSFWVDTNQGIVVPITNEEFKVIESRVGMDIEPPGWYMSTTQLGFNKVIAVQVEKENLHYSDPGSFDSPVIELHLINQKSGMHLASQALKPNELLVSSADNDHFYLVHVTDNFLGDGPLAPHTWSISQNNFSGIKDGAFNTAQTWHIPMSQGLSYPSQWIEFFTPFDENGTGFISINSIPNNVQVNDGSQIFRISKTGSDANPSFAVTQNPIESPPTNNIIHSSGPAFILDDYLWLSIGTFTSSAPDPNQSLSYETFRAPLSFTGTSPAWEGIDSGLFWDKLSEYQFSFDINDFDTHSDEGLIKFFDVDDNFNVDLRPIDIIKFNDKILARANIESSVVEGALSFEKWVLLDDSQTVLASVEFDQNNLGIRSVHSPSSDTHVFFQVVNSKFDLNSSGEVDSFTQPRNFATTLYKLDFNQVQDFINGFDDFTEPTFKHLTDLGAVKVRDFSQANLYGGNLPGNARVPTTTDHLVLLNSFFEANTIGNPQAISIAQSVNITGLDETILTRYNPNGSIASFDRKPGWLDDIYVDHGSGILVMRTETRDKDHFYIADAVSGRISRTSETLFNVITDDFTEYGSINPNWNIVFGTDRNDALLGNASTTQKQFIFSGAGNDTLQGGQGDNVFIGEGGINTVVYKESIDNFEFGTNNDGSLLRLYNLNAGEDTFVNINSIKFSDSTIDFMPVSTSSTDVFNLRVTYTNGNDIITTGGGDSSVFVNEIRAGGGNDLIFVGHHNNDMIIHGDAGNDTFIHQSFDRSNNNVRLVGGAGNDVYNIGLDNLGMSNGVTQIEDVNGRGVVNELVLAIDKPANGKNFNEGLFYEWSSTGLRVSSASTTLVTANLNAIQQFALTYDGDQFSNPFISGNLINPNAAQLNNGTLMGTAGSDVLLPIAGVVLNYNGGAGDDVIIMNNISGGKVAGGMGNDLIVVQDGILEGPDATRHTLSYEWAPVGATSEIRLDYGFSYVMSNQGALLGTDRFDSQYFNAVVAGGANDEIYGNRYANVLDGGAGNDVIYSGRNHAFQDRNVLIGGLGNDILIEETLWNDARPASAFSGSLMQGGAGNDIYVLYDRGAPATDGFERFTPTIVSERNPNGSDSGGVDTVRFVSQGEGVASLSYNQIGNTIQVDVSDQSDNYTHLKVGNTLLLSFSNGRTEDNGYTVSKVIRDTDLPDRPVIGFEVKSPIAFNQSGDVMVTTMDWSGLAGIWTDDGYFALFDTENSSDFAMMQVADGNNMLTYYDGEQVSTPLSLIALVDRNAMEFFEVGSNDALQSGIKVPVSFNNGSKSSFEIILPGSNGNAVLFGGGGTDFIIDSAFNDILIGGDGHDMLISNFGSDVVLAGAGNDFIRFRSDGQILVGGAGADHFQVAGINNAAALITDYKPTEGDRLSIDQDWLEQYFSSRNFNDIAAHDVLQVEEYSDMASFYLQSADTREHFLDLLIFNENQVEKAYEELQASIDEYGGF